MYILHMEPDFRPTNWMLLLKKLKTKNPY